MGRWQHVHGTDLACSGLQLLAGPSGTPEAAALAQGVVRGWGPTCFRSRLWGLGGGGGGCPASHAPLWVLQTVGGAGTGTGFLCKGQAAHVSWLFRTQLGRVKRTQTPPPCQGVALHRMLIC